MACTYTPGGGPKDDIRFAIGDTVTTAPVAERLEDEEIERVLALDADVPRAKVECAKALLAKIARRATDKTIGGTRLAYAQRVQALRDLIKDLTAALPAGGVMAIPYCGGISQADVERVVADTDRVAPDFRDGMFDNPRGA